MNTTNRPPLNTPPADLQQTGRYADRPEISWQEAWAAVDRVEEYFQRVVPTPEREGLLTHGVTALMGIRRALVLLKGTLHRQQ